MIDALPATIEVRYFAADLSGYRVLPLAADGNPGVASGVTGRITATEGYGEASFSLHGVLNDWPDLAAGRRVDIMARYRSRLTGLVKVDQLYRGTIRRIVPATEREQRLLKISLLGIYAEAAKQTCKKRYANNSLSDKSVLFADLCRASLSPRLSGVEIAALPVGDTLDYLDAYDVLLGQAVETLTQGTGRVAVGGDVNALTGGDRLFFRPFDDLSAAPRHKLEIPGVAIGTYRREQDVTQQATVLHLFGGAAKYPNLLAEAVQGNTSFEMPEIAGASDSGNIVSGTWSVSNGAAIKNRTDENVAPFAGNQYFELDHVNAGGSAAEYVQQINDAPAYALAPGNAYVLDCRSRLSQGGKPAAAELQLQWRNSSGTNIGSPVVLSVAPAGVTWDLFAGTFIAPSGAAKFTLTAILVSQGVANDAQYACLLDNVRLYDSSMVTQKGWQTHKQGTGGFNRVRWDDDSQSWHGQSGGVFRCAFLGQ